MIRAILAGGLVLGVGAAVTLAAWNDSEFVTGTFTAGTFNLRGVDDRRHDLHRPRDRLARRRAHLHGAADRALADGHASTAPFAVRLAANTTNGANVVLTHRAADGDRHQPHLRRSTHHRRGAARPAPSTRRPRYHAGTALNARRTEHVRARPRASPMSRPGRRSLLCFTVTAGAGLVQGQTGAVDLEVHRDIGLIRVMTVSVESGRPRASIRVRAALAGGLVFGSRRDSPSRAGPTRSSSGRRSRRRPSICRPA